MDECLIYSVIVLLTTTVIVYFGRNSTFEKLATICMFLPGLLAPWFATPDFLWQVLGIGKFTEAFQFSVMGGMLVILILSGVAGLVSIMGWGQVDTTPSGTPPDSSADILPGFLRAAGEEIGWRCFLLPCLIQHYGTLNAILFSGVIWAVYHMPVMLLLTRRLKPKHPDLTVAVQSLSIILSAFPHSWVAIKSGFSFWAPTVLHFTWNRLNPVVCGSIYTQEEGKIKGEQWLINGEGLAGCIVMLPIAILLSFNLGL